MSKIFISHSTIDKDEVFLFIDFLVSGMGINRDEIFYSSKNNSFSWGTLRKEGAPRWLLYLN